MICAMRSCHRTLNTTAMNRTAASTEDQKNPRSWLGLNTHRFTRGLPAIISVVLLFAALYLLHRTLHGLQWSDVQAHMRALGPLPVAYALLLTAASYLLLTLYDWLAMKYVQFELPWTRIAATAFSAYAIGNNVGLATLSGGAIRYRAYTALGIDATRIAHIVFFCSSTFFLGSGCLLGMALMLEPASLLADLPLSPDTMRAMGLLLFLAPLFYIAWTLRPSASLSMGGWRITLPSTPMAIAQLLIGSLDLVIASLVLFVLMPADMDLAFLPFLGIYLLCLAVAVISNVPGGIGVFEGAMLLLMPSISSADLLGALLLYRTVYYLLPFVIALILLVVQESMARRQQVNAVLSQSTLIMTRAAPQIIGVMVFAAGAALLFSGSLPSDAARLHYLEEFIPDSLVQVSHLLGSIFGLMLLILARGLHRRLEGAFWVALVVLLLGMLVSLIKGFDYEEATTMLLAAGVLWSGRHQFNRRASLLDEPFTGGWLLGILMICGGAIWLGFFAQRHVDYSNDLWWNFAINHDAPRMLRASLAVVIGLMIFGLARLLRTSPNASLPATAEDIQRAAAILPLSSQAEACVAMTGDKRFLFHPDNDAFIMYQLAGRSVVAMGDPVGNRAHFQALVWQYRELCDRLDKRCVFYQVSQHHLPLYIDLGLTLSKLGEEAVVPLSTFTLEGKKQAEFRQARNRGLRDGAEFAVVPASEVSPLLTELRQVSDDWLQKKHVREKGFSIGSFDDTYLQRFDVAIVRFEGNIVAFANLWPSGDKSQLSIDLMRHTENAPRIIMDYLFTELMLWGKEQGYQQFSLGMAPLSGLEHHPLATLWTKTGNLVFRFGDEFYNFDGLRKYKSKYHPEWHPKYLAAPGGIALPRVLLDATALISGGVKGVFAR